MTCLVPLLTTPAQGQALSIISLVRNGKELFYKQAMVAAEDLKKLLLALLVVIHTFSFLGGNSSL